MSKQSLLHGGSLLKPPSPLKQGRHSLGIRNGGLDFVKAAVGVFRAWRLPAERRLFFFCRRPADNNYFEIDRLKSIHVLMK